MRLDADLLGDKDETAAALGYTTHLVYLMAMYLQVPLRYPLQPVSSRSLVRDPVSIIGGSRSFPLYTHGMPPNRFHWAVYLLNKNIEQLFNALQLNLDDLRITLFNIKVRSSILLINKILMEHIVSAQDTLDVH